MVVALSSSRCRFLTMNTLRRKGSARSLEPNPPLRKRPGRTEFLRGIMEPDGEGEWQVRCAGQQGSGILSSMSRANCFSVLGEKQGDVQEGDAVLVQPFTGLI
ncbi:MAG TPA: hypothetical protein EYP40_04735 [Chromatiales bacterium]|nr:hypothetical protein [Chromatiales bacterium]